MKWNMDMKCFFKSIGRKTRLFFSLLFVWGFSQSNIQAQTTEVLVDIDFLSDEWSSVSLPSKDSLNDVYFDADFAIVAGTEGGLNNTSNMEGNKRFAAVQFTIPEGRTVEYVTLEVKMSKATGKMRARLMKADEIGTPNSYIILHAESNLISKQLHQYGADTQIDNNGTAIKPGSYVFYFGRGESGCYIIFNL